MFNSVAPLDSPCQAAATELFVVTGATGFVGSWCVKTLLDKGCRVRGTVRDPSAERCNFLRALPGASSRLELVKADLLDPVDAWRHVVHGCSLVLHTASPFVVEDVPEGEEEAFFLEPAVKGTEAVIKACIAEKVKRVVLTSSTVAIQFGHGDNDPQFTPPGVDESTWTNVDELELPVQMYMKSKTVAEMTAWELVKNSDVELAVVNPGLVFGPFLSLDTSSGSVVALRALLKKEYPAVPELPFNAVDVRDVANLHYLAAVRPDAAGKRHLAISNPESISLVEIAKILDEAGFDVPTSTLPDMVVRLLAIFDVKLKILLPDLGKKKYLNPINGNRLMDGNWIDIRTSMIDQANSMMELGGIGRLKQASPSKRFACC